MSNPALTYLVNDVVLETDVSEQMIEQHFTTLASWWINGEFEKLVAQGDEIIPVDIYDIRIVTYYLYSVWVVNNHQQFVDVIQVILRIFEKLYSEDDIAFKSSAENVKAIEDCTALLIKKIHKRLERFTPTLATVNEDPQQIVDQLMALMECLAPYTQLALTVKQLAEIKALYWPLIETVTHDADDANHNEINEVDSDEQQNVNDDVVTHPSTMGMVTWSHSLTLLMDKIALLEALVKRDQLYKAAVVVEDIQHELANFNPLLYLPQLFQGYTALKAQHISTFTHYIHSHNPHQWQALREHYTVDKKAFLGLSITPDQPEYADEREVSGMVYDDD